MDVDNVGASPDVWERVVRKLRAGAMPPVTRPRPDAETYAGFVEWLETELDQAAVARPNPGRTEAFHRLNRVEYHHAVRDLLDLDVEVAELLPADGASPNEDGTTPLLVAAGVGIWSASESPGSADEAIEGGQAADRAG